MKALVCTRLPAATLNEMMGQLAEGPAFELACALSPGQLRRLQRIFIVAVRRGASIDELLARRPAKQAGPA